MSTRVSAPESGHKVTKIEFGEFILVAVLAAIGLWLLAGRVNVEVIGDTLPGPLFMPTIVGVAALLLAALLSFDIVFQARKRHLADTGPNSPAVDPELLAELAGIETAEGTLPQEIFADPAESRTNAGPEETERTDWKTVGLVFATFVAAIALLQSAGWILTASFLFFAMAQILGRNSWKIDLPISFIVGSITYLIFAIGLGISLPAGLIGGA